MRKILLGLIGLLFAVPAVADLAPCRNLFDKNASYALFSGYLNNVSVGQNTALNDYDGGDKTIIIKVVPNTTYTVTRATNLGGVYDRIRCAAFTTLPSGGSKGVILYNVRNPTQANATFTTLSDTQYVAINVRNSGAVGDDWTQFVDAFQLELGDTATEYVPYNASCHNPNQIKIATTAYNTARFSPVVTELNDTIATIRSVVTNTINQTKAIADLQATKQTRPDEQCPAGKKCLLVEDNDGQPHWYEIIESASRLPAGYTELEYIESTGTQYIDTGAAYKSSRIYNVDFQYVVYPGGAKGSLGARQTSDAGMGTFDIGCNSTSFYFYNNSTNYATAPRDLARHTVEIDYTNSVFKFDGETLPWTAGTGAWQGTYNIYIGRENIAGSPNTSVDKVKWYSYKVYDNGVLIQNLIPAKNSSNVVGMYDLVSGQFLTNQGTGTFVAGPEI